jgi:hypothetical protein
LTCPAIRHTIRLTNLRKEPLIMKIKTNIRAGIDPPDNQGGGG